MNRRVAEAFRKLYFGKRTGVLTCEAKTCRRAVHFQSGFVVAAQSSRNEDRLGELMMRHGRITRQQFEDASHFIKSGWRLGEILAELKIIGEEEIEAFVRLQLLEIATTQLVQPPRRLAFSPVSGVDAYLEAPLSVADILLEAARRTPRLEELLKSLRNDDRRLGFSADPLKRFQDVSLKPEEAFVLSRIDGNQTASDIFAVSPLSEEQTARTLWGLLEAGIIEPEGEPGPRPGEESESEANRRKTERPSSRPASKEDALDRERAEVERLYQEFPFRDHWQVLGVERGASRKKLKEAFFRGARRFHPDRYRRITDPEFQEKLSYVFRRVNEAHEILSSERAESYRALQEKESQYRESQRTEIPSRDARPPSPAGGAPEAEAVFRRAQRSYEVEDFWDCIQLCQQSLDMAPGEARVHHLLGLALSRNPKWRQDAEKNFKIAANLEPFNAAYVLALAHLYRDAGLHLRARKAFEQARAIDPTVKLEDG